MGRRTAILALFVALLISAAPAAADPAPSRPDPATALETVTERIEQIDRSEKDLRSKIAESRAAATKAEAEADAAGERVEELRAEVEAIEERLRERAVDAFTGRYDDIESSVLDADPLVAEQRKMLLEVAQADDAELADMLEKAKEELNTQRAQARRDRREAKALEAELVGQLDDLTTLRDELADQVADLKKLIEAKRPAGTAISGSELCDASGIKVSCAVADDVNQMIAAAAADGLVLSGGGYRDPAEQIALRRAHCGSSYQAIYVVGASACSPPTARPGTSQHELGLAIDFRCNGASIGQYDRSNPCVVWLAEHAAGYGFHPLKSEAWHWSTTGN